MCCKVFENVQYRKSMITQNISRFCAFLNRQFILPPEKSATFRKKRDWLCTRFGFNLLRVPESFLFEARGRFKQAPFSFPPIKQAPLSAPCFFRPASKALLSFFFPCGLLPSPFWELLCSWGLNNMSINSANVDS